MSDIPENVVNKELYRKVKKEADGVFEDKTSAYKSMWISKTYKKRGGKYTGKKDPKKGTIRWSKGEEWVQIKPYLKGEKVACGADNKKNKACRPLKKVSKDTPITMNEIIKKWGVKKVVELTTKKINDMEGRLNWQTGTFSPSS